MRFGRSNKKTLESAASTPIESSTVSQLKELCGSDNELYVALSHILLLDPQKIQTPLESFVGEAKDFEAKGNRLRAEIAYRIAGGVSLYRGDVEGVKTYFSGAAGVSGDSKPEYRVIAKRANEAVDIARKFYELTAPLSTVGNEV